MPGFVALGEEVAGYRLESFIGRGGMAVVYRAHDLRLGRQVAVKILAPELAENERFRQRFVRESQLAASIDHPNIIPIYEAGETEDLLYIVMRYVDGRDLKALLEREGRLEAHQVVELLSQVAGALDAAHAHGLVHRDVKPGNILVASGLGGEHTDHVYLTDFGLTKKSLSLTDFTTVGHFVGTIDYVAPEQISSQPVDGRADIYALGCVMFQCLTGALPFERDDNAATLWAHMLESVPPLTSYRPDLPPSVNDVFYRAMAKSPDDRYPTCRAVVAALSTELGTWRADEALFGSTAATAAPGVMPSPDMTDGDDEAAARDIAAQEQPRRPGWMSRMRGRRAVALGVGLGVVVAALVAVFAASGSGGSRFQRYVGGGALPVTLDHPAAWRPHDHGGLFLVFSPQDITSLFNGLPSGWVNVDRLLRTNQNSVTGVYVDDILGGDSTDPAQLQQDVNQVLQLDGDVNLGAASPVVVNGRSAFRFDGTLQERGGPGQLRFSYYVVPTDAQQQTSVQVMTFASPSTFQKDRPLFARVLASLDVHRVHAGS